MDVPKFDPLTRKAYAAVATRQQDPRSAVGLANSVISTPEAPARAVAVALVAKALAERELGHLEVAEQLHRESIELAVSTDLKYEEAWARSSLSGLLVDLGRAEEALHEANRAEPTLGDLDLAELEMRRGLSFDRLGKLDDAIDAYSRAVSGADRHRDVVLRARIRANRGVALTFAGRINEAVADLVVAESLAGNAGHDLLAAGSAHNLAFAHGRNGDMVVAFEAFERAKRLYDSMGAPPRMAGLLEADRCGVLLGAGLLEEARRSGEEGVSLLAAAGEFVDLAEARLLLARVNLAACEYEAAIANGGAAVSDFEKAERTGWAAMARYVTLRAAAELGRKGWFSEADAVIEELVAHGWSIEADDVRIFTAKQALRSGDSRRARRALRAAAGARTAGRPDRRAQAWLATALLREADGNLRGARSALRSGLKVLDDHRDLLGATELRVGSSNHAAALASMGVALSLDQAKPSDVLVWADRLRASALDRPPTRPPDDAALAAELAQLRGASADLTEVRLAGGNDREAAIKVVNFERAIRDRARRASATAQTGSEKFGVGSIRAELGEGVFVEYLEHDGRLHAVTVDGRRSRLCDLGPIDGLDRTLEATHFGLRRLAGGARSDAAKRAASAALAAQLLSLSNQLLGPIVSPGDTPIVIVPTGALHRVPWSALPVARRRQITVSPSGSLWLSGSSRASRWRRGSTVFVAGPDLEGGRNEVNRLRRSNAQSTILTGRNATVDRTLDALGSVGVAHIAAHGDFRSDSPMFSSLRLHDGPLTLYDLEGLRSVPHTVVLPACDAGAAEVTVGDEVTGTATALLGLGVASVIAPIAPISDHAATPIMMRLHKALVKRVDPAAALAEATVEAWESDDPTTQAVAASFSCFGISRGKN